MYIYELAYWCMRYFKLIKKNKKAWDINVKKKFIEEKLF